MNDTRRLILASASPRRRQILSEMGFAFDVEPCDLPEPAAKPAALAPAAWAEALAFFKARAVAETHSDCAVLGADTIVVCSEHLLGKPRDLEDARRMLEMQAGRETDVITGVALIFPGSLAPASDGPLFRHRILGHATTRVWMRDDQEEREAYLRSGDWQGKAGAYGIQDVGDRLIERIAGGFANVVGLPDALVRRMLAALSLSENI